MRQVNGSEERGDEISPSLQSAGSAEELARQISLAQGQARLTSDLTLGLLHKLNNVMTSIYFTAEGCETEVESGHPVREMLSDLTRAVRDAQQLINQTSEVNLTLGDTVPEYHDLNVLVRQELFLMKMLLPKNTVVEIETMLEPAFIRMSIADFRRVLFSLASNASDAAGTNPRVVLQTMASAHVSAEEYLPELTSGTREMVALVFKDDGDGMSPEALGDAFLPFFTTREDRLGLGLFEAQEIARRNGGQLAIRHNTPTGAEVVWFMPRIVE